MWSNTSIELVKWGKLPRRPLNNDQRLQQFRRRLAESCSTGFNTFYPAGKIAGHNPKEQHR